MIRRLLIGWLLSSALALASAQDPAAGSPPAATEPLPEQLRELVETIRGYCEDERFVGAEILIRRGEEVLLHQAVGLLDREAERPMPTGTIYNLRSMTKSVVGAAAQILVDEGRLALSDPVAKHLPAFDQDGLRQITVDQVLAHRAGFPLTILTGLSEYEDLQAQAAGVAEHGVAHPPGSKFWYSDAGADVMGALVEAASGEALDAFVRDRLLEPLGMADSFFQLEPDDPRWQRVAKIYMRTPSGWACIFVPAGESMYPFAWGSQSLYGTPEDYCRFLQMWADGGLAADGRRVLSARAVASQLEPLSPMTDLGSPMAMPTGFPGMEVWYGRMAVLYRAPGAAADSPSSVIGHSGSDGTIAWAWPDRDLTAAVFTQSRGASAILRVESDLHRLLFEPDINRAGEERWRPLLGRYRPEGGRLAGQEVEVLVENGRLAIDVPGQLVFLLTDPDDQGWRRFVIDERVRVRFEPEEGGLAPAFAFEAPGEEPGLVRRVPAGEEAAGVAPEPPPGPSAAELAALEPLLGVYHDVEGDAEVQMLLQDGRLTARHPQVPIPLQFLGPDEDGFFTLELNPGIRIVFTRDEQGAVDGYDVHANGVVTPRPRLRGLDDG